MKKILLVSVLVLLAASCKKQVKPADVQVETKTEVKNEQKQGSLKQLMSQASPQKCIVSSATENSQSEGTVFIANGKMRGDFVTEVDTKTTTSHMISDGKTLNGWSDETTMGFMFNMDQTAQATTTNQQAVDVNSNYNYNCEDWKEDSSKFELPKNIEFKDFSALQTQMQGTTNLKMDASANANIKAVQCNACAQAGEGKAQCLAMFKCE